VDEYAQGDPAPMMTLCISGGKKDKLRPGDVLGALTGDAGLTKDQVGKINVTSSRLTWRWTAATPTTPSSA
jgi:ATP-independent RNA helicase DbpA